MPQAAGITQAGLVRRKNCLSLVAQSIAGIAIGGLLWFAVGMSLTFGKSQHGLIGDLGATLNVALSVPAHHTWDFQGRTSSSTESQALTASRMLRLYQV